MQTFVSENINDLPEIAENILQQFKDENIFALFGKMGSGKTTLIKEICKIKKVNDNVTSPTFALINEYLTESGEKIYHFDFYRIESPEEVFDFGYEDYFFSGNMCLIEWPELIENLLPENYVKIEIKEKENGFRYISCSKVNSL